MQWERLIDELEADLDAEERRELAGEVADRTRRELARLHLVDRLRAAAGRDLTLGLEGSSPVRGRVHRVGPDWLLIDDGAAGELLVLAAATMWVEGLPPRAVDPAAVSPVDQRLGVGSVLRATARDRRVVHVRLRNGTDFRGTVSRVGADFVDIGPEPRSARAERCLPLAAVASLRLT
ncbi:MAG: hypothetical protein QOD07_1814 [Frankiaceae bacterium]|jgi:hypothetical protein|nr:hypothetical protein [Frankiaceae bacterium]